MRKNGLSVQKKKGNLNYLASRSRAIIASLKRKKEGRANPLFSMDVQEIFQRQIFSLSSLSFFFVLHSARSK